MSAIKLEKIIKLFGSHKAVDGLSIEIPEGELLALLGPSGCGKTTTLRMIAGFLTPGAGRILFNDKDVTNIPVDKRNIGMVFQGYALFPHLSIARNIEFGLKMRGWSSGARKERVLEMLDWVRLSALSERRPSELSGGQQQRVAVARAMAARPDVLLLDEPFSALDAKLRKEMQKEIRALQQDAGITTVFVTHDQNEAMTISDRIGVLNEGALEQIGTPEEIYKRPETLFVANFIGECNVLAGGVKKYEYFELEENGQHLHPPRGERFVCDGTKLCLRPEDAVLLPDQAVKCGANGLKVTLEQRIFMGREIQYEVVTEKGTHLTVKRSSSCDEVAGSLGMQYVFEWEPDAAFLI